MVKVEVKHLHVKRDKSVRHKVSGDMRQASGVVRCAKNCTFVHRIKRYKNSSSYIKLERKRLA